MQLGRFTIIKTINQDFCYIYILFLRRTINCVLHIITFLVTFSHPDKFSFKVNSKTLPKDSNIVN